MQEGKKGMNTAERMRTAAAQLLDEDRTVETLDGELTYSWMNWILSTLFTIAARPEEYGETAAVEATRLIWEMVKDEV